MARFLKDRHLLHALALTVSRHKEAEEAAQRAREELSRTIDQLKQERTERKREEEKLLHAAEGWRTTFDSITDLVSNVDKDFKLVRVNKAFADAFNMKPKELIGKTCYAVFHRTKEPRPDCPCKKTFETKKPVTVEFFEPRLGTHLEVSASPILDDKGEVIGSVNIAKDITERKRVEEELHLLLTITQAISESQDFNIALGVTIGKVCEATGWDFGEAWLPSRDGKVLEYSPACYSSSKSLEKFRRLSEKYSFPPKMGLPGRVWSSKQPEWFPDVSSQPEAVFRRFKMALEVGFKAGFGVPVIADGRVLAVLVFFMVKSRQEDKRLVEVISGVAMQLGSVIQHKQAEEALKQSEGKYRSLVNNVQLGVFRSTPGATGRFLEVNPAMEEITGYSREELLQMNVSDLYAHPEEREAVLAEVALTEDKTTKELCFNKKDGAEITVSDTKVAVRDSAGRILFFDGILADITERKRMEEQLIVTDRLASVGELAAGIAHELNNPLTSVIGFSELLLGKAIPEDIRKDIEIISREAQHAAEVVKNLLTFARKHPPVKQLVNINSIIEKVLELRTYEHKVSNIQVNTQFAPDLPAVMADYSQLQQVAFNIIVNAEHSMIEAHNRGTLTITTKRAGNIIKASFADDGHGIAKENLGHLFDPFFTTKEVGKGTGLGLSICHGIVTEHGGQIYAESELGKGATFVVELPIVTNDDKGH